MPFFAQFNLNILSLSIIILPIFRLQVELLINHRLPETPIHVVPARGSSNRTTPIAPIVTASILAGNLHFNTPEATWQQRTKNHPLHKTLGTYLRACSVPPPSYGLLRYVRGRYVRLLGTPARRNGIDHAGSARGPLKMVNLLECNAQLALPLGRAYRLTGEAHAALRGLQ